MARAEHADASTNLPRFNRWVPIDEALSWICSDGEDSLAKLLESLSGDSDAFWSLRTTYELAWRELAYAALVNRWEIRGYREHKRRRDARCSLLVADDLDRCTHLDFVLYPFGREILISEYGNEIDAVFNSIVDPDSVSFAQARIRGDHLKMYKPRARGRRVMGKGSIRSAKARSFLSEQLKNASPCEVTRAAMIKGMRQLGITNDEAKRIWKEETAEMPQFTRPGRRPKTVRT